MSSREERMAKNEAASRETNEQAERAHEVDPPGRRIQISCECALKTCGRTITITVDEYGHVRMDPGASVTKKVARRCKGSTATACRHGAP